MRRSFSIFLVLFFALGPLSGLMKGSEDASLPPCCRRHGAHRCAMYAQIMAMRARLALDPGPSASAPSTCPLYPGLKFSLLMPAHAVTAAAHVAPGWLVQSPTPAVRMISASPVPLLAHAGRGPPAAKLI